MKDLQPQATRKSIMPHFSGDVYSRYLAGTYDFLTKLTGWKRMMRSHILRGLEPGKLLDIGCGTGQVLEMARKRGFELYGIDPSEGMLDIARQTYPELKAARLVQTTADKLPFNDASFDCAIASGSMAYVPNMAETASEIARILKPGGVLRIIEHTHPVKKNLMTPFIYFFTHISGDLLHDFNFYYKKDFTLKEHQTLGRGGYLQRFDFVKK